MSRLREETEVIKAKTEKWKKEGIKIEVCFVCGHEIGPLTEEPDDRRMQKSFTHPISGKEAHVMCLHDLAHMLDASKGWREGDEYQVMLL